MTAIISYGKKSHRLIIFIALTVRQCKILLIILALRLLRRKLTTMQSFDFVPVSVSYIKEALDNLNPRKAVGCDNISQRLLRLSSPVISEPLTCLINHFISNRISSAAIWKSSNIVPVFKKESGTDKTCYRPVSVLTALSKLYGRVIFDQRYEAFYWRLSPNLSGYLRVIRVA